MNPSSILVTWLAGLIRPLAGLGLAGALVLGTALTVRAQGGSGATDLPFVSATYRVTCGWHLNCHAGRALSGKGIDLGMGMNGLVTSAGNGTVQTTGYDATWGNQVVVNHDGGSATRYAHLNYYFANQPGLRACRYVGLGYSGNTGRWTTAAHLHFQDDGGYFTPVFGARDGGGGGSEYQKSDFDPPFGRPPNTAQVSHSCGPRGGKDCRKDTRALTVDEVQSITQPSLCGGGCEYDEFDLNPWGGGDWKHIAGGFGYGSKSNAKHFVVPLFDDGPRRHQAIWSPRLGVTDPQWDIYAFIPETSVPLAKAVRYTVQYCANYSYGPPRRCLSWGSQEKILDQQYLSTSVDHRNGWVPLFNGIPSYWSSEHDTRPIVVRVYDDRVGACRPTSPGQPSPCRGQQVAADAVMFLPSSCE